jgi:tRNA(fMet)-specific endonuclease VapC
VQFLLDTNAVSDLIRNPQGKCAARIALVGERNVSTSIIVAAELRYGALKKNSLRLTRQLEAVLAVLSIAPFEAPADSIYARIRTKLEAAGKPIGGNDLLIASHALALNLTLITDNEREFARVDRLQLENWMQ